MLSEISSIEPERRFKNEDIHLDFMDIIIYFCIIDVTNQLKPKINSK